MIPTVKGNGKVPTLDSFYFRLSENNLYYSETQESPVVLGACAVANMFNALESEIDNVLCFQV